jgi:hypothetical protein
MQTYVARIARTVTVNISGTIGNMIDCPLVLGTGLQAVIWYGRSAPVVGNRGS